MDAFQSFPGGASGKEPACQCRRREMQFRSLGWEDALEEGRATHSSILAWRTLMDRGARQATVHRVTKSRILLKRLSTHACMDASGLSCWMWDLSLWHKSSSL